MDTDRDETHGRRRAATWGVAAAALLWLTGSACELDVSNPTNIEDADLASREAVPAIVAGAAGDVAEAAAEPGGGGLFNAGAMLSDELVHVGTWVGLRGLSDGRSHDDWAEAQSRWGEASQARWVSERGIERVRQILEEQGEEPSSSEHVAELMSWAGHANRILGDHFCNAVINGGEMQSHTVFYERAEQHFTNAISVAQSAGATSVLRSAYGGRAHTRMMLGDWSGAVSDAGEVPISFQYMLRYTETGDRNNMFLWWGFERNETSVWGTPFAEWGTNVNAPDSTADPRVPYDIARTSEGNVVKGGDNRRPFWRQLKWTAYADDIPVIEGTEMRLLEGEGALVTDGDIQAVEDAINDVRTHHNETRGWSLPMVSIDSEQEAWQLLMKERGLELWLQGKRLPDLRRWADTPGSVPFEVVREEVAGQPASADPRLPVLETDVMQNAGDLCLRVSKNEKDSNSNL